MNNIENNEQYEIPEVICNKCVGVFQKINFEKRSSLFSIQIFQKWIYRCNSCGLQSKVYCTKIKKS